MLKLTVSGANLEILHVIRSLNLEGGGPSESVRMFALAHQKLGWNVEIVTLDSPDDGPSKDGYRSSFPCPVHPCGPAVGKYGYSHQLQPWLLANRSRFDGVIVNGVWQYHSLAARRAFAGRVPYAIFSHGMLDPYFKKRFPLKHLKKLVYWTLEESRNLNQAHAVCVTSQEEFHTVAEGFPFRRFRRLLVPYGSAGPEGDPAANREAFLADWPHLADKRFLLFLGRIHPKKGCDLLMDALARSAEPDLHLVMAGPDEVGWTAELKARADALGIGDRITWTGMLRGAQKWGALYAASAFILPSHQENFGIAVADALACGLIPLISDKVNIAPEVAADQAAFVDTDTVEGTSRLIERFQRMTSSEREAMQAAARACYVRRYSLIDAPLVIYRALGLIADDPQVSSATPKAPAAP